MAVWGRSSTGRARRSQCRGWGFEPPRLHQPHPEPLGRSGHGLSLQFLTIGVVFINDCHGQGRPIATGLQATLESRVVVNIRAQTSFAGLDPPRRHW